jgi:hypothetical protein
MFNININYTTARMDYAISARPSRTPIVIRGKSRWTQKSDRGNKPNRSSSLSVV